VCFGRGPQEMAGARCQQEETGSVSAHVIEFGLGQIHPGVLAGRLERGPRTARSGCRPPGAKLRVELGASCKAFGKMFGQHWLHWA